MKNCAHVKFGSRDFVSLSSVPLQPIGIIIPFLKKKDRAFFLPLTLVSTRNNIIIMIQM